jgi:hypothetical protein
MHAAAMRTACGLWARPRCQLTSLRSLASKRASLRHAANAPLPFVPAVGDVLELECRSLASEAGRVRTHCLWHSFASAHATGA